MQNDNQKFGSGQRAQARLVGEQERLELTLVEGNMAILISRYTASFIAALAFTPSA